MLLKLHANTWALPSLKKTERIPERPTPLQLPGRGMELPKSGFISQAMFALLTGESPPADKSHTPSFSTRNVSASFRAL